MNPLTPLLSAAFRKAAAAIDPASNRGGAPSPARVEAWVTIEAVRGQTRWIDAAVSAAQTQATVAEGSEAAWLHAWCRAWMSRAAPAFRRRADELAEQVAPRPESVGPLLSYWRITGGRRWLDRALEGLPEAALPGDAVIAEAFRQAWRATADPGFRSKAELSYGDLARLDLKALPGAAELLGRSGLSEDLVAPLLEAAEPETIVQVTAALGLPLLRVEVQWWLESELREGPVAEAITYPWPALEIRFAKLADRDQVRFQADLDGQDSLLIVDAGVVGIGLAEVLKEADRSAFLEAAGRRRRSLRRR
jgi:hypothetical protein